MENYVSHCVSAGKSSPSPQMCLAAAVSSARQARRSCPAWVGNGVLGPWDTRSA